MAHSIAIVAVVSVTTILLRFLPFWVFGNGKGTPRIVANLGKTLPFAAMGMLVIYCMKDTTPQSLPEIAAFVVTALLHIWKRSSLLSILGGTVTCIVLHAIL